MNKKKKLPGRGPDGRFLPRKPGAKKPRTKKPAKKAKRLRDAKGRFVSQLPPEEISKRAKATITEKLSQFWNAWLGSGSTFSTYVFPSGEWVSEGKVRTDPTSYLFQISQLGDDYPLGAPKGEFSAATKFLATTLEEGRTPETELVDFRRGGGFINVNQTGDSGDIAKVSSILAGQTHLIYNAIESTSIFEGLEPVELVYRIVNRNS